jgi:hypothetical protein
MASVGSPLESRAKPLRFKSFIPGYLRSGIGIEIGIVVEILTNLCDTDFDSDPDFDEHGASV